MENKQVTAEYLLTQIAQVVAGYHDAEVRLVLNRPVHWLVFVVGDNTVAQICIESGELMWINR